MLNQIILVGRLTDTPILETLESGKTICNITLAVPRSYKNADGVYEIDFINCTLWNGIARNTTEHYKKGDLIGIKGRLETEIKENEDGTKFYITNVIAEKSYIF